MVDTYDDETTNHTFHQVRKMIEDKFKITVTYEAIRKVIMLIKTLYQLKIVKTIKLMMGMELILLSTLKQKNHLYQCPNLGLLLRKNQPT